MRAQIQASPGAFDRRPRRDVADFCIEIDMHELGRQWIRHLALWLMSATILAGLAWAATPGSFRGTVVEGESGAPKQGWLYVRGRNGSIRRVDVTQASFAYDEDVETDQRKRPAREAAGIGADVRVTAEQGSDGEWRASRVEVVKPAPSRSAGIDAPPERRESVLIGPDLATAVD